MPKHLIALCASLFTALAAAPARADADPGALITRPSGYTPMAGDAAFGEKLFKDSRLSSNGMSCASCHAQHGAFQASFALPYPHAVAMAGERLGRQTIHLDEMIQACMMMPMKAQPLPWDSRELAGLAAYLLTVQKTFKPPH